jgi:hypothetical protein
MGEEARARVPAEHLNLFKGMELKENEVQALFRNAEELWERGENKEAARCYRRLLDEFGSTRLVREKQERIEGRAALRRDEIVIWAGDWKDLRHPAWKAIADPDSPVRHRLVGKKIGRRSELLVEFEAAGLLVYHVWIRTACLDKGGSGIGIQFPAELSGDVLDMRGEPLGVEKPVFCVRWLPANHNSFLGNHCWGWADTQMGGKAEWEPCRFKFKTPGRKKLLLVPLADEVTLDQVLISPNRFLDRPPKETLIPKPEE